MVLRTDPMRPQGATVSRVDPTRKVHSLNRWVPWLSWSQTSFVRGTLIFATSGNKLTVLLLSQAKVMYDAMSAREAGVGLVRHWLTVQCHMSLAAASDLFWPLARLNSNFQLPWLWPDILAFIFVKILNVGNILNKTYSPDVHGKDFLKLLQTNMIRY